MKLCMKQKVFSLKDRFQITDTEGTPLYEVEGKLLSIGHKLYVRTMTGEEVAFIHEKVLSLMPKFYVVLDNEEYEIRKKLSLLHPHYTVEDLNWEIRGKFTAHDYEIHCQDELIATMHQKWFSWGDTYLLEVPQDKNALMALAVVLAIDCCEAEAAAAASSASN